jgi:hypothetical protein
MMVAPFCCRTGGSAMGLSATGAWLRAAADDGKEGSPLYALGVKWRCSRI